MYVRRRIRLLSLIADSWRETAIVIAWSGAAVILHEGMGLKALAMPVLPVSVMGIAVSLYLGFKGRATYDRWWEARQNIGELVTLSRLWASQIGGLVGHPGDSDGTVPKQLVYRHLAIIYAIAQRMRQTSRLSKRSGPGIFGHRRPVDENAVLLSVPDAYERFLSAEEAAGSRTRQNVPLYLLTLQTAALRQLVERGTIDLIEEQVMLGTLNGLTIAQGRCERIKTTPFPRQITNFGFIFTWIFVLLLPLAVLDSLVHESITHALLPLATHEFISTLMALSVLIAWVFIMMEKISDSTEEPFEGSVHDVPLTALCRTAEIELRESLGETDLPKPLQSIDDVLY